MSRYLRFDDALETLEAHGTVQKTGNGWYKTNCPAHDDKVPSLSFRAGSKDGNFVPKCMADCTTRAVVQAIYRLDGGLSGGLSDLKARRMQEYLTAKDDWTDAELGHLFKVTDRTIRRWIRAWEQDGLRWTRKPHGKIYDISEWSDRTSEADSDSDRTQRESRGADVIGEGNGSSPAADLGGTNQPTTTTPRGLHSENRAQNVRSLAGPIVDYDYLDPRTGGLVAIKRRHIAAKEFRWHRPRREKHLRTAGIAHTLHPLTEADLPLYNAYKLGKYPLDRYVFVVEGEKAVDALTKLKFMAVCFPGGAAARNFQEKVWKDLVNRRVILWPDNDKPGRELMRYIEDLIDGWVTVKSWAEPDVPPGGDAYDYIEGNRFPDDPFEDGPFEAVQDLIPVNPTVKPGRYMTHSCGLFTKHVGAYCLNPRCTSKRWESSVDDEEWEDQSRGANVLWEEHVRMEVRLFDCLDGCTHAAHNDDQPTRVKEGSGWVEGPSVKEFITTLKEEAAVTP